MENTIYQTVRPENGNLMVKELNANVALSTFKQRGIVLADLYKSNNSAPVLVAHNSCAPVNCDFVGTVKLGLLPDGLYQTLKSKFEK